jgi:putative Holliday junction resolvase
MSMRILGIDYGTKRIGLAITDERGIIAQPLMSIRNDGDERAARKIAEVAHAHKVSLIVVGIPRRTDGKKGVMEERSISFASLLGELTGLPVELFDERFTTAIAERALLEADLSRRKRKQLRDKVAAAIMLQSYLQSLKGTSER